MDDIQPHISDCVLRLAPLLIRIWRVLLVPAGVLLVCAGGFSGRVLLSGNAEVSQDIVPLDADHCISYFSLVGRAAASVLWWDGQLLSSRRVIRQSPATHTSTGLGCSRYLSC